MATYVSLDHQNNRGQISYTTTTTNPFFQLFGFSYQEENWEPNIYSIMDCFNPDFSEEENCVPKINWDFSDADFPKAYSGCTGESKSSYSQAYSGCFLLWNLDQVDYMKKRLRMKAAISYMRDVRIGLLPSAKALAKWHPVICNRLCSHLSQRSDQDDPISLPPDTSTSTSGTRASTSTSVERPESEVDVELGLGLRNTTERTSPISNNASSENPEEGDGTETPHEIQQLNNSPEHFGTIILFFIFELVFYAMRDSDHNHSSSSNWHSYYFGATTAVSFITTLCAIYLRPKHKVAARILQKIGVMTAASGVIVALFNLFLPGNIIWIGFLASLIVYIVVALA